MASTYDWHVFQEDVLKEHGNTGIGVGEKAGSMQAYVNMCLHES